MIEESNPGSANIDREWIDKILEILLLNTSVEEHPATKKMFFEIAFQMFHEGSFYSEDSSRGTIYLGNFLGDDGHFDFSYFESVIRMAVRFIDNEHIRYNREDKESKVILNLDGFSEVFDIENTTTHEGKDKTYRNLTFFAMRTAISVSMDLAEERGPMDDWELILSDTAEKFKLKKRPIRNSITIYAISAPKKSFGNFNLT